MNLRSHRIWVSFSILLILVTIVTVTFWKPFNLASKKPGTSITEPAPIGTNDQDLPPALNPPKGSERQSTSIHDQNKSFLPEPVSTEEQAYAVGQLRNRVLRNGNVTFYGKVLDAQGSPLANVRLTGEIMYYEPSIEKLSKGGDQSPTKSFEIVTDQNGEFSIEEQNGSRLTLMNFQKNGYSIQGRTYYRYWFHSVGRTPHVGDSQAPEVFVMTGK